MPNVNPTETNLIKTDSIENSQSNNYFDVEILRKQTWEKLASLGTTKNYFKPSCIIFRVIFNIILNCHH